MARRGLIAILVHEARVAAREKERAERAAVRDHMAAMRRFEQAQRAAEKAQAQLSRASQAERKRLEKEAREAHVAAMEAEVEEHNYKLAEVYAEIDSLLAATLEVDDYVDLEMFRVATVHPPFPRLDLESPIPPPNPIPDPPEPIFRLPDPPQGLLAKLFGKGKYAAEVATAEAAHRRAVQEWRTRLEQLPALRQEALDAHARSEAKRIAALQAAQARYAKECSERETADAERNKRLDELIANLGYGIPGAVQEYVSIVMSNSVYPEQFPVTHEFQFEPSSAELILRAVVPGPGKISEVKAYKYTKSTDEITSTSLSQKVARDRYASAVHQVALRSIHEVFEADRRGLIRTISLEVGAETIDPATGRPTYVPFVVVGVERETFLEFDLAGVVPSLTLERLRAAVSKNPHGLIAAETTGVRRT
jgi:restriction system protein